MEEFYCCLLVERNYVKTVCLIWSFAVASWFKTCTDIPQLSQLLRSGRLVTRRSFAQAGIECTFSQLSYMYIQWSPVEIQIPTDWKLIIQSVISTLPVLSPRSILPALSHCCHSCKGKYGTHFKKSFFPFKVALVWNPISWVFKSQGVSVLFRLLEQ